MMERKAPLDARGILGALHDHEVEYVMIGGLAVIAYGSTRITQDIDIVPKPTPENLARLAKVVAALEGELVGGIPEHDVQPDLEGLSMGGNFCLDTRAGGLDVMQDVEGAPSYDELAAKAVETEIFGLPVKVPHVDHLIRMKQAAGRPKDLDDIATLEGLEDAPDKS